MNIDDLFDDLDDCCGDELLLYNEALLTNAAQAWVDGDHEESDDLYREHKQWQCNVLASWWNLSCP